MLLRWTAAVVALALAACGDPGPSPACDLSGSPAVVMSYVTSDGELRDLVDGAVLPLIRAPQGGHILLLGARIQGVDVCSVTINAALRDPCNNIVVGLEQRPINLRDRGDGWAVPVNPGDISNFANVAVCPVAAAANDIDGHSYQAEIRIMDGTGGTLAMQTASVMPACEEFDSTCYCECDLSSIQDCGIPEPDGGAACPTADAAPPDAF